MNLGGSLVVAAVQLVTLLIPLGIGLTGLISGGVAGLLSIVAWALIGVPASYAIVDIRQTLAASAKARYTGARVRPIQI